MYKINNFVDNDDIEVLEEKGPFKVIQYKRDLSVNPYTAPTVYFSEQMNVKRKQLVCDLSKSNITLQAGAMQWMVGEVNATTGIKGVGDFFGKKIRGAVTKESTIKPEYTGSGQLITEPTYKHLIVSSLSQWNGSVVLDDGLFLACDSNIKHKVQMRSNLSSATLGNEGLFNLRLDGNDECFVIESVVPYQELIEIELEDDVIKVDGPLALAWSSSLDFTVERSGKSLIGSAASGEGLVNVYRGSGKIWISPVAGSSYYGENINQ